MADMQSVDRGTNAATPDLDAVELRVTRAVELDYIERNVFPGCRADNAAHRWAASAVYYLTPALGQAVLDDALLRHSSAQRTTKAVFKAHVSTVRRAIKEAKERRAELAATGPICEHRWKYGERWRGTKEHIRSLGIAVDGPWPGELGGKRWTKAHDKRGYKASIKRALTTWPGLYLVDIELPKEASETRQQATSERERLEELKKLPATPDQFRAKVADAFWLFVRYAKPMMQPKDGYRLADEAVEEFMDAVSDAYWAIKNGETTGRSPRETLQEQLQANAQADAPLQRFLSSFRSGDLDTGHASH